MLHKYLSHEVYVHIGDASSLYLFEGLLCGAYTPKQDAFDCEF